MKKQKIIKHGLLAFVLLLGLVVTATLQDTQAASAACSAPATSYGSATMEITIPANGNYRIWTHMFAAGSESDSYLLEIDGNSCFTVGDGGVAANAWSWVDYSSGNKNTKVTANLTAGKHTLKAIGREPHVKFDRILAVADQNCVPTGAGDNCMVQSDTTKPNVSITEPADFSTVKGNVIIKANATDNSGIAKVEFYVQNTLKATDTTAPYEYNWDTKSAADGSYAIMAKAYDAAGNTSYASNNVTVENNPIIIPPAPTDVTATATQATQVVVKWKPGSGATSDLRYRVIRNNVAIATIDGTSYTDNSVAASTTYGYQIVAVNKDNTTSPLSSPTAVTTPAAPVADTQKPTKPTKVSTHVVSSHQINLSWQASTDDTGIKNYDIYRSQSGGAFKKVATVTSLSYGDTGLFSDVEYTYYIVAHDTEGNESPASDKVTATTYAMPFVSTLRGTVKSSSGRPVIGAKVSLWADGRRFQATTNWRGKYKISRLPAGVYQVQIKANNFWFRRYSPAWETVHLSDYRTKWLDVTLRQR